MTFKRLRELFLTLVVGVLLLCHEAWMGKAMAQSPEYASESVTSDADTTTLDWQQIHFGSAMPRSLPVAEADEAIKAGFPKEWALRALSLGALASARDQYLKIISEKRSPGDDWAYGIEHDIWSAIKIRQRSESDPIARVFCNGVGCLIYLEHRGRAQTSAGSDLARSLQRDSLWSAKFGLTSTSTQLWGGTLRDQLNWSLIIVLRPKDVRSLRSETR